MRNYVKKIVMLLLCGVTLCSCHNIGKSRADNPKGNMIKIEDFCYPTTNVETFCLDEKGYLYTYETDISSICIYDESGEKRRSIKVEKADYKSLCVADGKLYAGYCEKNQPIGLYLAEISMLDGARTVLFEEKKGHSINGMEIIGNKIYFMILSVLSNEDNEKNDPDGGYYHHGEKLLSYDLDSKKISILLSDYVYLFCKKGLDGLLVYAYDPDNSEFYFSEIEKETGELCEKCYAGENFSSIGQAIAYDDSLEMILCPMVTSQMLVAVNYPRTYELNSFWSLSEEIRNGNDIKYQNEYTYLLMNQKVTRIYNSQYIRNEVALKVYSEMTQYVLPEGMGYTFDVKYMSDDAIATAILAGDSDYDFLLFSTESALAEQIRRTGAYEPLNQVEGINDYFSDSFDYLREAATASNGSIWMLPYEVNCNLLVYQPELCRQYGFEPEKGITNEDLLNARLNLYEVMQNGSLNYECFYSLEQKRIIDLYLADYAIVNGKADFHSELFRKYSELLKRYALEEKTSNAWKRNGGVFPLNDMKTYIYETEEDAYKAFREYYKRVAFVCANQTKLCQKYGGVIKGSQSSSGSQYGLTTYEFFDVTALPSLEEDKEEKNVAYATFLVLNPNSKNIEEAKDFLKSFLEILCETESISRTKELKGSYTEIEIKAHDIFENSRIVFSFPKDVFEEEYAKYLRDEKTLEEIIPELERKMNLFINE